MKSQLLAQQDDPTMDPNRDPFERGTILRNPNELNLPKFDLAALESELADAQAGGAVADDSVVMQFSAEMAREGFAILSMDQERSTLVRCVQLMSKRYFAQSEDVLSECSLPPDSDVGYVNVETIKQFYQMRCTQRPDALWPSTPSTFKPLALEFYDVMMHMSRTCLSALARGCGAHPDAFVDNLLDPHPLPEDAVSSTIYRWFSYTLRPKARGPPCQVHTDVGVITLIPASNIPALQILSPHTFNWIEVEQWMNPNDVICFIGETLERHCNLFYKSVIHRVVGNHAHTRYSQVFLVRGRPDAVLDPYSLQSDRIGPVFWDLKQPITVAQFLKEKYEQKQSANFLEKGQGVPTVNISLSKEEEESAIASAMAARGDGDGSAGVKGKHDAGEEGDGDPVDGTGEGVILMVRIAPNGDIIEVDSDPSNKDDVVVAGDATEVGHEATEQ